MLKVSACHFVQSKIQMYLFTVGAIICNVGNEAGQRAAEREGQDKTFAVNKYTCGTNIHASKYGQGQTVIASRLYYLAC